MRLSNKLLRVDLGAGTCQRSQVMCLTGGGLIGHILAQIGTFERCLAYRPCHCVKCIFSGFASGPHFGCGRASGQFGQRVQRHFTLRCFECFQETRIAFDSAANQRLPSGAVNVSSRLTRRNGLAFAGFQRIKHFRQIRAQCVAGNIGCFLYGNLAQVSDLATYVSQRRAQSAATGFIGCAFNYVLDRLGNLRRAFARCFTAQINVGQFHEFFTHAIA